MQNAHPHLLVHGNNWNGLRVTRFSDFLTSSLGVVNEDFTQLRQPERINHWLISRRGDQEGALTRRGRFVGCHRCEKRDLSATFRLLDNEECPRANVLESEHVLASRERCTAPAGIERQSKRAAVDGRGERHAGEQKRG